MSLSDVDLIVLQKTAIRSPNDLWILQIRIEIGTNKVKRGEWGRDRDKQGKEGGGGGC